jgi:hypothetical protein
VKQSYYPGQTGKEENREKELRTIAGPATFEFSDFLPAYNQIMVVFLI